MKLVLKNRKFQKIKRILYNYGIIYSSVILMLSAFLNIDITTKNAILVSGFVTLSMYLLLKYYNDKKMKTIDRELIESLQ